jgi:probable phosphoglycerate mutase
MAKAMPTDLVVVRHGETAWNRELRFQGQRDVVLNDMGHEQARRVALHLAGELVDAVYSSDLLRACETAQPTADALGREVLRDEGLREQSFGIVEGLTAVEIRAGHPEVLENWARFDADYQIPQGESIRQFHTRVMAAVQRLAARHAGQRLLVFTHGGVLDMLYRSAKHLALSGPRPCEIPNGGVNRLSAQLDGAGVLKLEVSQWADVAHLQDLPAQPRYDQKRVAERFRSN